MALPEVSQYMQPTSVRTSNPVIPTNPANLIGQNPNMFAARKKVERVKGYDGACNYALGPDSSDIVADDELPVVWFIATDQNANKVVVQGYYVDRPYTPPKPVTMEDLLAEMREMKERLNKMEEGGSDAKPDNRTDGKPKPDEQGRWSGNQNGAVNANRRPPGSFDAKRSEDGSGN